MSDFTGVDFDYRDGRLSDYFLGLLGVWNYFRDLRRFYLIIVAISSISVIISAPLSLLSIACVT